MSNRTRGDHLERQTIRALNALGYYTMRSAGSHGLADVIALIRGSAPYLIQCKIDPRRFTIADRKALIAAAESAGATALVATRETPGWVTFYALHPGTAALVEYTRVKVPPNPKAAIE